MEDFRDIEVKSGNHSLIVTVAIGLLSLLILLISFSFKKETPEIQPIEIAMNFGNTETGLGEEEPMPAQTSTANNTATSSFSKPANNKINAKPTPRAVTQNTTENRPTDSNKKNTTPTTTSKTTNSNTSTPQPQGDQRANDALNSILSGRGKTSSSGQGNQGTTGNVGDPKGSDSNGTGIGENWKSTIPEPQQHQCTSSGTIVVEIIVNAAGNIKSATPGIKGSTSADACLKARAKELVLQYVKAYPGTDGRKGVYRVNLR